MEVKKNFKHYNTPSVTDEQVEEIAKSIIATKLTVRKAASIYKISKSSIHKLMKVRLLEVDSNLHKQVAEVFAYNYSQRSIRGGLATKQKHARAS